MFLGMLSHLCLQVAVLLNCLLQEWTDANMRWNTSEYSDIKDIRIPPAQLWKPDILMYNRSVFLHAILYVSRLHWQNPFVWCLFVNISLLLLIRLGYKWLRIITCVMLVMVRFLADECNENFNSQILLNSELRIVKIWPRSIKENLLKMLDSNVVNVQKCKNLIFQFFGT